MKLTYLTLVAVASSASATAIGSSWFNGNFDARNGLSCNGEGGNDSETYDQFGVGPAGANVSAVYIDVIAFRNLVGDAATFNWSIRSGVTNGSGGTFIAGSTGAGGTNGSGVASVTLISDQNPFGELAGYQIEVTGITGVNLSSGLYWLGGDISGEFVIDSNNSVYTCTTGPGNGGSNNLGGGNPSFDTGLSFWNSTTYGENWVPTSTSFGPGTWDLSMGINGSDTPEPSSAIVLAIGAGGLLAHWGRRSSAKCRACA